MKLPSTTLADRVGIVGLVILSLGAALVYAPAGLITFGGLLLAWAVAASRTETP